MYGEPEWLYEAGNVCVYDIEHLFGRDLILARSHGGGKHLPLAIHSHGEPMQWLAKRWATRWAIATDSGDYATAALMSRNLGEHLV